MAERGRHKGKRSQWFRAAGLKCCVERSWGKEASLHCTQGQGKEGDPQVAGQEPWDSGPSENSDPPPTLNERNFFDSGNG